MAPTRQRSCSAASIDTSSTHTVGRDDEQLLEHIPTIDLTSPSTPAPAQSRLTHQGDSLLASYQASGSVLRCGDCVEIDSTYFGTYPVSLMIIRAIVRDGRGRIVVRGTPLVRNEALRRRLPGDSTEVAQCLELGHDEHDGQRPALIDAHPRDTMTRLHLLTTNAAWPTHATPGRTTTLVCR